jgi:hypothetical protein
MCRWMSSGKLLALCSRSVKMLEPMKWAGYSHGCKLGFAEKTPHDFLNVFAAAVMHNCDGLGGTSSVRICERVHMFKRHSKLN